MKYSFGIEWSLSLSSKHKSPLLFSNMKISSYLITTLFLFFLIFNVHINCDELNTNKVNSDVSMTISSIQSLPIPVPPTTTSTTTSKPKTDPVKSSLSSKIDETNRNDDVPTTSKTITTNESQKTIKTNLDHQNVTKAPNVVVGNMTNIIQNTTSITVINGNSSSTTANVTSTTKSSNTTTTSTQVSIDPILPHKGAAKEERDSSMAIFFVLSVIASCIFLIHFILETKFQYIPESLAVVFLGAAIGLVMKLSSQNLGDWKKEETLSPTMFFLVLLPPIIYESGYTLHKGNFFQNIGSILVFAIIGTSISAFVIGGGVYLLGCVNFAYKLSFTESFAFGSLISAVDPVATLAIFHALNLDPILNMLVFGESILNDAVAIVLATTALEFNHLEDNISGTTTIFNGFVRFFIVFFGSAAIGAAFALIAALIFKYVDLRKHPSLEFGMMLILIYAPYGLAEGLHLSGIMAILFNGVVMSHYAHFNLSPVTQITMQQTLRTLAFIAETCVFAYLGLAIFSFHMKIELSLIIWSIILCLIGRAVNIYPLSYLVNYFREHKISKKMMFIMWFCGLRGAIAYALALHLDFGEEKRRVIVTTTLIIVLFTIIIFGSSTMPVLKYMNRNQNSNNSKRFKGRRNKRGTKSSASKRLITLSKTQEMGQAIETEHLSELTEEELEVNYRNENNLKGFVRFDAKYMMPLFTRIFTDQEVNDCKSQMTDLTNRWYQTVRRPSESEDDYDDDELDYLCNQDNDNDDLKHFYEIHDRNRNYQNHSKRPIPQQQYFIDIGDEDDGFSGDIECSSENKRDLCMIYDEQHSKKYYQQHPHKSKNKDNQEKQSFYNNNKTKKNRKKLLSEMKKGKLYQSSSSSSKLKSTSKTSLLLNPKNTTDRFPQQQSDNQDDDDHHEPNWTVT